MSGDPAAVRSPAVGGTALAARPSLPRRVAAPVGLLGVLGGAVVALQVRDPHQPGSWGWCPFLAITGVPCPLCGGLRAVADLSSGRPLEALGSNAAVVVAVPVLLIALLGWTLRRARGRGDEPSGLLTARAVAGAVVLCLVFGAARLLPALAWLRP